MSASIPGRKVQWSSVFPSIRSRGRAGQDYSSQFRQIVFALKTLRQGNLILDGEIVALDENGRASFQELQNRRTSQRPIVYYVFDVLHHDGRDTLDRPLSERRKVLDAIGGHFSDPLRVNPQFRTKLPALIKQVKTLGLEGIVAKRSNSIYVPGKESDAWQKHRFSVEAEFVIGGYRFPSRDECPGPIGNLPIPNRPPHRATGRLPWSGMPRSRLVNDRPAVTHLP